MRCSKLLWLLFISMLLALSTHAKFVAHVEHTTVAQGMPIELTLEYDGQIRSEPDLSELEKDFTIVSRQNSSETQYNNGNFSAKTSWILEILPKNSATTVVIPSISLGGQKTAALTITISDQKIPEQHHNLEIKAITDRDRVYVNGELIVHHEIKTPLKLRNVSLGALEIKNVIVEPLVEAHVREVIENGIKYIVYGQSFALYPSKAGQLEIPPVLFKAMALISSARGISGGFGDFFSQRGSPITAQTQAINIEVKPIPAKWPADQTFLPLRSLDVSETWDPPRPVFEVGKAVTRRFEISAKGTLSSSLPQIVVPSIPHMQIYAENGERIQKMERDGMLSSNQFSHIYIPSTAGHIVIPEQTIYWWDTSEDTLKTTVIKALEIDVAEAAGAPVLSAPPADVVKPADNVGNEPASSSVPQASASYIWPLVTTVLIILWMVTVLGFLWLRRSSSSSAKAHAVDNLEHYKHAVDSACKRRDAKAVVSALLALAAWSDRKHLLSEYREVIVDKRQRLEALLYHQQSAGAVADELAHIRKIVREIKIGEGKKTKLASLYPL